MVYPPQPDRAMLATSALVEPWYRLPLMMSLEISVCPALTASSALALLSCVLLVHSVTRQHTNTLETKYADLRSGAARSATAVACAATAEWIRAFYACLDVAACHLPMISQPFDSLHIIGRPFGSHRIMHVIVNILRPESIVNIWKA